MARSYRRRLVRRGRRLASSLVTRSKRPRTRSGLRYGALATGARLAGAAARGVGWLRGSRLGKRVASAAAGYAAGLYKRSKTKETDNGAGASAQYNKVVHKLGRYKTRMQNFTKLIQRNMRTQRLRFGAVNRFTDAQGAFQSMLQTSGATTLMPIHLLELTSKIAFTDTADNPLMNVKPFWRPYVESATGLIGWSNPTGRWSDGVTQSDYYNTLAINTPVNASNAILEWTNAKFLFRCPKTRPGWFKVSLVSFTDEELMPLFPARNSDPKSKHHAFWQNRLKQLVYNPIAHEATNPAKSSKYQGLRIIKTWTKRWNPDTSDNLATYNGEQIRLDLFIRHNRYVNSSSGYTGIHTNIAQIEDDAYVRENNVAETGQTETYFYNTAANPKARLFFLIETTQFDASEGPFSVDKHVSFDMEVRNNWIFQDGSPN